MKVFCLTYAGGNAEFYDDLEKKLADSVTLIKHEYSGHGKRYKEELYTSMEALAADAYKNLKNSVAEDEEYSIIGYSMGCIAAIELLKKIISANDKQPQRIFLAAHEPYTLTELSVFGEEGNEELVKERTIQFGAVPNQLINNKSFWRVYLPIYKADYSIIGKYRFEDLRLETDIPATIFYSETDTPFQKVEKWKQYFINECDFIELEGNHFFIKHHTEEMANIIRDRLERA